MTFAWSRSGLEVPVMLSVCECHANGKRFFAAQMIDQTKERQIEVALAQQHSTVASLVSSMFHSVLVTDPKGIICEVNTAAIALFGYSSSSEMVGHSVNMLMPR